MPLDSDCDWLLPVAPSSEPVDRPGDAAPPADPLAVLLAATAAGDCVAFKQLYDATSAKLLGVAMRLLRRRDAAEDALQDAYLRIWSKAGRFDASRGPALPWLAQLVRNASLDHFSRMPRAHDGLADHAEDLLAAPTPIGDRLDLAGALETIGPRQSEAVLLSYLHGYTHEELADRLGVPLGTAKTWVRRGAERLRTHLDAG
jgi:RNA polymerase sigma-70 factor (ECF subfamily)